MEESYYVTQSSPFQMMKPAVTLPEELSLTGYIANANSQIAFLEEALCDANQQLAYHQNKAVDTVNKELLREYAKELGRFDNVSFLFSNDGVPFVEKCNGAKDPIVKLLTADRHFSVCLVEPLDADGVEKVRVFFMKPDGTRCHFEVIRSELLKSAYKAYCAAGGVISYHKSSEVPSLFAAFINSLLPTGTCVPSFSGLWKFAGDRWFCSASEEILNAPLVDLSAMKDNQLITALVKVYGFLEGRIRKHLHRLKGLVNMIDPAGALQVDASLSDKPGKIRSALKVAVPILHISAGNDMRESGYQYELRRNNLQVLIDSGNSFRNSLPVLVSRDLSPFSNDCLVIEYTAGKGTPHISSLKDLTALAIESADQFDRLFEDAFSVMKTKLSDIESTVRDAACALFATSRVICWAVATAGNVDTASELQTAFEVALLTYAERWDNWTSATMTDDLVRCIRSSIENGDLRLYDRRFTPADADLHSSAFIDDQFLFITSDRFRELLAKRLKQYDYYAVIQSLIQKGLLECEARRRTVKASIKLDTGEWKQVRCLCLQKDFLNHGYFAGIEIIKGGSK